MSAFPRRSSNRDKVCRQPLIVARAESMELWPPRKTGGYTPYLGPIPGVGTATYCVWQRLRQGFRRVRAAFPGLESPLRGAGR
ncbi:MAG: hypothetical protein RLY86_1924 [Pseudomonadota bacterium]|jgi:hypothetical protein